MKTQIANCILSLGLCGVAATASAQSFTEVNVNGNYYLGFTDISGFPLGTETYLGGVPFDQNNSYGQVWNAFYAADEGSAPTSLTLSVDIPDATGLYSLINTWWGQDASAGSFASVSFGFTDGSSFTKDLFGNQDIRDFNNPGSVWTTSINGTTTQPVYQNTSGSAYYIDRQWFDFSAYGDAGKTLDSITFNDTGNASFQRLLVSGVTVQSGEEGQVTAPLVTSGEIGGPGTITPTPEPSTMALAALGGASLLLYRRRK